MSGASEKMQTITSGVGLGKAMLDAFSSSTVQSVAAALPGQTKTLSGVNKVCDAIASNISRTVVDTVYVPVDSITAGHLNEATKTKCDAQVRIREMELNHEKWERQFKRDNDKADGKDNAKATLAGLACAALGLFAAIKMVQHAERKSKAQYSVPTVDAAVE